MSSATHPGSTAPPAHQPKALTLPEPLLTTTFFQDGWAIGSRCMTANGIAAFDGPPGTGKTTCATYCAIHANRPSAVVTLPAAPAPLELLRRTYAALTDHRHHGTRYQMQDALVGQLSTWRGLLVVDEMQNVGVKAMQELVWLYEETGRAFSLIAVGTGVLDATAAYPQLESRIMGQVMFQPLTGAALVAAAQALDPRFAATDPRLLTIHDQRTCRGLLRRWIQTQQWLDLLNIHTPPTLDDFTQITSNMQVTVKPAPSPAYKPGPWRKK